MLTLIEYANIEMFNDFQELVHSSEKVEEVTIASNDVSNIDINSDGIQYNDRYDISVAKTINLKVEKDLTLNVDKTSIKDNGIVNFEFAQKDGEPTINVPSESFNDEFLFGVTVNNNKAIIKFENTNNLPVEIKGSGNLALQVPEE